MSRSRSVFHWFPLDPFLRDSNMTVGLDQHGQHGLGNMVMVQNFEFMEKLKISNFWIENSTFFSPWFCQISTRKRWIGNFPWFRLTKNAITKYGIGQLYLQFWISPVDENWKFWEFPVNIFQLFAHFAKFWPERGCHGRYFLFSWIQFSTVITNVTNGVKKKSNRKANKKKKSIKSGKANFLGYPRIFFGIHTRGWGIIPASSFPLAARQPRLLMPSCSNLVHVAEYTSSIRTSAQSQGQLLSSCARKKRSEGR